MHAFTRMSGARTQRPIIPRLSVALVTLVTAIAMTLGLMTTSAHAAEPDTRGLCGQQDPTDNGVYRQSASVLGLAAVGITAPRPAVTWLLRQQCDDGSFTGYRLDPTQAATPDRTPTPPRWPSWLCELSPGGTPDLQRMPGTQAPSRGRLSVLLRG